MRKPAFLALLAVLSFTSCKNEIREPSPAPGEWPSVTNTQKPWTRWWWMGNAVDKKNLTANLESFAAAGIGGVEITPIYGVKGSEGKFLDFLSPEYLDMLRHTVAEADRLGMQVDMIQGTGWPFGGPQVEPEYAATRLAVQKYDLSPGNKLPSAITIDDNRQKELARLLSVLAYSEDGSFKDMTSLTDSAGNVNWTPPDNNNWKIYAIFAAKTRQMVKRAAPGGAGFTLDHFSSEALADYCELYDTVLKDIGIRAMFNDSYEVFGADFTPEFFTEFEKYRGYDLRPLMNIFMDGDSVTRNLLMQDYRETINDLLINGFAMNWKKWANKNNFLTRFQAHGAPANIIDLYSVADIPECETFGSTLFDIPGIRRDSADIRHVDPDPVMLKFSSSAAHLAGLPLISSESFTWVGNHFKVSLSQCRPELDQLFLSGVNHIVFQGSTYTPAEAEWPGWKFYATVNFNSTYTLWQDAPSFFNYATRCQSILQLGKPDNELLVYWPYYDALAMASPGQLVHQFSVHTIDTWLHPTNFYKLIGSLKTRGYSFDFITDKFISEASVKNGQIVIPGGTYKALVIPSCMRMLPGTLSKLESLIKKGAVVIFEDFPSTAPGYYEQEKRSREIINIATGIKSMGYGDDSVLETLEKNDIYGEAAVSSGVSFIRRKTDEGTYYFFVNHTSESVDSYLPLNAMGRTVVLYDPATGDMGLAKTRSEGDNLNVLIQLEPGETIFAGVFDTETDINEWKYIGADYPEVRLEGEWLVEFTEGGPSLPEPVTIKSITPWETWSEAAEAFSGTARYTLRFTLPATDCDDWILDMGDVRESARIKINGEQAGTLWSIPFRLKAGRWLKQGENLIEIEVTNLGANRIRSMEQSGKEWKIFYDINMVDVGYQKFDATLWDPMPSGLTTTPVLIPFSYLR